MLVVWVCLFCWLVCLLFLWGVVVGFVVLCACWFCCVVCLLGLWGFVGCVFVGGDCEG